MKAIGLVMVLMPFVLIGYLIIKDDGWGEFFVIFGGAALLFVWFAVGADLLGR